MQMENIDGYFHAKITIRSNLELLEKIKSKLGKNQNRISLFRESVFAQWLDIPPCHSNDNHLLNFVLQHQVYIPKLLDTCPPITYRIGDNLLRFGREEFLLVTGFLFGPLPDHVVVDRSPFALRIFPHKKFDRKVTVKGNELLHILNNDKVFDALPTEDAVRVCLLICAEVIFTGRGPWYNVPNEFLQLVEDFNAWNGYPWGEYLWRRLYASLANLVPKHYQRYYKKKQGVTPDKTATYNICGFIWAFKV